MKKDLAKDKAHIDAIYYCPHHPDDNCNCRKPKIDLIKKAVKDFDISLKDSYVVGDRSHDIELAKNVGSKPIRINNYGDKYPSFNEAVNLIIKDKI